MCCIVPCSRAGIRSRVMILRVLAGMPVIMVSVMPAVMNTVDTVEAVGSVSGGGTAMEMRGRYCDRGQEFVMTRPARCVDSCSQALRWQRGN